MTDGRVGEFGTPAELAVSATQLLSQLQKAELDSGLAGYSRVEIGSS